MVFQAGFRAVIFQELESKTGDRILRLEHGYRYAGSPGRADYDVLHFDTLTTRVSPSCQPASSRSV